MSRDPLALLILTVLAGIIYLTLYPFAFIEVAVDPLRWMPLSSRGLQLDALLNLYFFLPIGLLLGIRFRRAGALLPCLLGLALLSLSIEYGQAYIPGRISSLNDVLLNTLGGAIGLLVAQLPVFDRPLLVSWPASLRQHNGLWVLLLAWMAGLYFPFIPLVRMSAWFRFEAALAAPFRVSTAHLQMLGSACFAVLLWHQHFSRRATVRFALIATCALPLGFFILDSNWLWTDALSCLLGYQLALILVMTRDRITARQLAWAALIAVGMLELIPNSLHFGEPQHFEWIPFGSSYSLSRTASAKQLATKAFLYWFTARQLALGLDVPMWRSACYVSAYLFLGELAQIVLPGRTPETTDPILALLAGIPAFKLKA